MVAELTIPDGKYFGETPDGRGSRILMVGPSSFLATSTQTSSIKVFVRRDCDQVESREMPKSFTKRSATYFPNRKSLEGSIGRKQIIVFCKHPLKDVFLFQQ